MGHDDDLLVVEMLVVTPPFLLDFAKAHLDSSPEFPAETMREWEGEGMENFGDRWPDVKAVLWSLRQLGIYYFDAKPGNIHFGDREK